MMICCDISGEMSSDKYWVLGSAWIPKEQLPHYEKAVCDFRMQNKLWGEIKWTSVSPQKLKEYKHFLKLSLHEFPIEIKVMLLDREIITPKYYDGDEGKMLSTFYYTLLKNHMPRLSSLKSRASSFDILIDKEKWVRDQSLNLKNFLSEFLSLKDSQKSISHLSQCDSKVCSLLQLCDLIIGAISATWNSKEVILLSDKKEIIKHIEDLFELPLNEPTFPTETKFNLWLMKPYQNYKTSS